MNTREYLIIANGKYVTKDVSRIISKNANQLEIMFKNGKRYTYDRKKVFVYDNPKVIDARDIGVSVKSNGEVLDNIKEIYEFGKRGLLSNTVYWHIIFNSGYEKDYYKSSLKIVENCLKDSKSGSVFSYIKDVSQLSNIKNDDGFSRLYSYYEKIKFISPESVLAKYLNKDAKLEEHKVDNLIFPFGGNSSQFEAVRNALENQLSVIEGPPGTGKTQTILNIIANLLLSGKSILVVSNNNSATENIVEKLSSPKYGFDFMVAMLGSSGNKKSFLNSQTGVYPDISKWNNNLDKNALKFELDKITAFATKALEYYNLLEKIALLRKQKADLELEQKYFYQYVATSGEEYRKQFSYKLTSQKAMNLWVELLEEDESVSLVKRIIYLFKYGIFDKHIFRDKKAAFIKYLQDMYYRNSLSELETLIKNESKRAESLKDDYATKLEAMSLHYFKQFVYNRYFQNGKTNLSRRIFTDSDLFKEPYGFLREYPIVLSTTFSSVKSLNLKSGYDYIIMDEASQVDIATGALAFSFAKNAVIVGDQKQLPNVVDNTTKEKAKLIAEKYDLNPAYDFTEKSILESICDIRKDIPKVLLKEHYRCSPKIIEFCNKKFYDDQLVVMTKDNDEDDALCAYRTVEGNHQRDFYNQRQIDVNKEEVLPSIKADKEEIGIIAPYNEQVNAIRNQIPGIDVATVHKFQGREKDIIILSTVDDNISEFTDDPNLLNVAVSRAKKKLILVVTGNKQEKNGNITDLLSYIQYNKMEIVDSKVYSVFDYLYGQYSKRRRDYLKNKARISEYDSENLTFDLIKKILASYDGLDVVCFQPLSMIVKNMNVLSEAERQYASNVNSHLDFLIYRKINKQPVMAIETDGYAFHKEGTRQAERDKMKNSIISKCGLKIVRLKTNESGEEKKIRVALDEIV